MPVVRERGDARGCRAPRIILAAAFGCSYIDSGRARAVGEEGPAALPEGEAAAADVVALEDDGDFSSK
jgi:hypothetical protein